MRRLMCDLFGHRNITFLTYQIGTPGVHVGAACLRCHLSAVDERPIGYLIPQPKEA